MLTDKNVDFFMYSQKGMQKMNLFHAHTYNLPHTLTHKAWGMPFGQKEGKYNLNIRASNMKFVEEKKS